MHIDHLHGGEFLQHAARAQSRGEPQLSDFPALLPVWMAPETGVIKAIVEC